jgi:hypothetical protein
MMLPLKINIPVLLPPDMPFEVLTAPQQVYDALSEQGWAKQAVSLSDRVSARIKSEPLDSWIEWEGYFTDHGDTRDLGIFGVLYCNGTTYLRGIFVPNVSNPMLETVQDALPQMLTCYLDSLGYKNVRRNLN